MDLGAKVHTHIHKMKEYKYLLGGLLAIAK